jgi:hypothetical protein
VSAKISSSRSVIYRKRLAIINDTVTLPIREAMRILKVITFHRQSASHTLYYTHTNTYTKRPRGLVLHVRFKPHIYKYRYMSPYLLSQIFYNEWSFITHTGGRAPSVMQTASHSHKNTHEVKKKRARGAQSQIQFHPAANRCAISAPWN